MVRRLVAQPGQAQAWWIKAKAHEFAHREREAPLQRQALGQVSDLGTHRTGQFARRTERMAKDPNGPCRPGQQTQQSSYQAAFAGTVGTHQSRVGFAGELKAHLLHSQLLATANAQAFNHKHWGVVCHWPKAWRRSATLRRITLR